MAIHPKFAFTQFLVLIFPFFAAVVAELSHETTDLQPAAFANDERLYGAYLAIQRFKSTITADPKNITATWSGHDICSEKAYLGFHCSSTPGLGEKLTVTHIIFNGFDLTAPRLQGFIDELPDVAVFHASSNSFGGEIPHLTSLPYLFEFNIAKHDTQPLHPLGSGADFRGGAVGTYGSCTITFLNVTYHIRVGSGFPPAGLTDAKALILNHNSLSGQLPANIGFSKLSYLAVANNKLTGPIPPSIAQARDSLQEVLLLNNQLSGCLPHELGMLTKTSVIDAGKNQLTGPIPSSFSCLSGVEQLNLGENRLYGQVPDALCNLGWPAGRLANLTLSSNYFTSVGPACSALIKDGVLDVKRNCIPGFANQRSPAECAAFLSQPKACPAAASGNVACPTAADARKNAVTPEGIRDYSSYVTYATLHE